MLDTNILISGILSSRSAAGRAVDRALAECVLLSSESYLAELREVVAREKFDHYVPAAKRIALMETLIASMRKVSITAQITVCRDPKDDKILELAVSGQADLLVTGDHDLLALHPFEGIDILAPLDFLASPNVS